MIKKYRVHVSYPMPYQEETDKFLHNFPGWYGSGFDGNKRENALDANYKEVCEIIAASTNNWSINVSSFAYP